MQEDYLLTETVVFKVVVELTNDCVGSFATVTSLVSKSKEVYLPRNFFTSHSKNSALPRGEEINGSGLLGSEGMWTC